MEKQIIIITGASRGIGQAIAQRFGEVGCQVYDLSRTGQTGQGVVHLDCDVTDASQVQKSVQTIVAQTGRIDGLLCNAGFGIAGAVEFALTEDVKQQMAVNFEGALNAVQAVLPIMRAQKRGRIVFTSSVAAVYAIPFQAFYSASKAAVNAMAYALQNEVRSFGIQVSVLQLGDVCSSFTTMRKTNKTGEAVYSHMLSAISSMEKDEKSGMQPAQIAQKVVALWQHKHLRLLYTIGWEYKILVFLERLFPKRFVIWVLSKMYA